MCMYVYIYTYIYVYLYVFSEVFAVYVASAKATRDDLGLPGKTPTAEQRKPWRARVVLALLFHASEVALECQDLLGR